MRQIVRLSNGKQVICNLHPKKVRDKVYQCAACQWGGKKIQKLHPTNPSEALFKLTQFLEERVRANDAFRENARRKALGLSDPKPEYRAGKTFEQWALECVESVERRVQQGDRAENTARLYRNFYANHILGTQFGMTDIRQIDKPVMVIDFINERGALPYAKGKSTVAGHSTQWKQLFRRFLSLVFNYARENTFNETIPQPVTSKTAFAVEHQYKENFTVEEVEALFKVARNLNEKVILALGFWGVRPAEICAARWSKLSQDGTVLHLDKQLKFSKLGGRKGEFVETKPKTKASVRSIKLQEGHFVFEVLQEAKKLADPTDDFILQKLPNARKHDRITAPYISKLIPELCRLAEIPVRNAYVMKASAISFLALNGVDISTTSAITGVSVQTLLKHYDRANRLSRQDFALPKFNVKHS